MIFLVFQRKKFSNCLLDFIQKVNFVAEFTFRLIFPCVCSGFVSSNMLFKY